MLFRSPQLAFALGGAAALAAAALAFAGLPRGAAFPDEAAGAGPPALRGNLASLAASWVQGLLKALGKRELPSALAAPRSLLMLLATYKLSTPLR